MNLINNIILDDTVIIPCTVRIMYTRNSRNKYVGGGRKKEKKKSGGEGREKKIIIIRE